MTAKVSRIAFYADIFYDHVLSAPYWIPPADLDVEAIILGGDIHYSPDHLAAMLKEIRDRQKPETQLIVVPGNGEYVDLELNESRKAYRAAVARVPNATFLDDESTVLPSGLRVIGSTLWSMIDADKIDAYHKMMTDRHGMTGVDNIRLGDRYLTFADTNVLHLQARDFIENELQGLSEAERDKTIVCTHFWPTLRPWIGPDGKIVPSFSVETDSYQVVGSNLDTLIERCGPKLWLCGHVHETKDFTIGGTRILCNPRTGGGPNNVNPDFRERCIVEL